MTDLSNFNKGQLERWYAMQVKPLYEKIDKLQAKIEGLELKVQNNQLIYSFEDVRNLFKVSRQTMYNWEKEKKLIRHKINGRVYYKREDIEKLINHSKI